MKPLLILIAPVISEHYCHDWHTIWCAPHGTTIKPSGVDELFVLPPSPVSPLCQALLAVQRYSPQAPVAISTGDGFFLPSHEQSYVSDLLIDEDKGVLRFPSIEAFVTCAQDAIRYRNPADGWATLRDAFHQAQLFCFTEC